MREIEYQSNRVIPIEAAPGYQVTVLLSPDEQIKSIAVGDSSGWQVSANKSGNNIFVKYAGSGFETNMTVVTNVRLYSFELVPLSGGAFNMPYILKFAYPSDEVADETVNPGEPMTHYRMKGAKSLWPSGIVDDGRRTFIEWPLSADIPAVYAIDQAGNEVLTNGMMRDDRLVIEAVASKLVFRIDKKVARATRMQIEASQ
ncbi:MAG: TrbG/VirB9 family P-type conjugative transfer protein [Sphingorhabdus sp.]